LRSIIKLKNGMLNMKPQTKPETNKMEQEKQDGYKKIGIKLDKEMLNFKEKKDDVTIIKKRIGNVLDDILYAMEELGWEVPAELMELKQWLRGKGNSLREQGDLRYWQDKFNVILQVEKLKSELNNEVPSS